MESGTPGYYHASKSVLAPIDRGQRRLLRELALTDEQALAIYSLAPLSSRRYMAMLGFLHRISFGCISNQIQVLFAFASPPAAGRIPTILSVRRHQRQFREPWFRTDVLKRSTFGLTVVYDLLPPHVIASKSIKAFQSRCRKLCQNLRILASTTGSGSLRRIFAHLGGWLFNNCLMLNVNAGCLGLY